MAKNHLDDVRDMQIRSAARARQAQLDALKAANKILRPFIDSNGIQRKYPPGTIEKPCTRCGVIKQLGAYMALKIGALGRHPICNECRRMIAKKFTKDDREAKAGRPRPECCDCCGSRSTARRPMHWDHDHATSRFRGWLCHYCNAALGHVNDSVPRLELLIAYLNRGGGVDK